MKRAVHLLLPLVLVLAFVLRTALEHDLEPAAGASATSASFDDPRTAAHAARIEHELGSAREPRFDRFLDSARGAESPWLAFYDRALAALVTAALEVGGASRASAEEARLESFLARLAPILGVLTTLAVFWSAARAARGTHAWAAGLFAATLFAVAPIAVSQGSFARLDPNAWLALLCALEIAVLARALRESPPFEILLGALLAGLVAGIAVATSPIGVAFFAAGWLGFLALAMRGPRETRAAAQRAGLLFCAVASFASHLSHIGTASVTAPQGLLAGWSTAISRCMLASAIPFLLGFLLSDERKGRGRATQSAIIAIALAAILYYLPQSWRPLHDVVATWTERRDVLALAFTDHRPLFGAFDPSHGLSIALLVFLLFPLAAWSLVRGPAGPEREGPAHTDTSVPRAGRDLKADRVFLLALAGALWIGSLVAARIAGVAIVPIAITIAVAVADGLALPADRRPRIARSAPYAVLSVIALDAVQPWFCRESEHSARERTAFIAGLRTLRAGEPGGVVATFPSSGLIEYHARRPLVGSAFDVLAGEEPIRTTSRALLASEPMALVRCMRAENARYLVVAPRDLRRGRELAELAGGSSDTEAEQRIASSLLARFALADPDSNQELVPGFVRVHASKLRVTVDGHTPVENERSGPAISIYRLEQPVQAFPSPEIRPR